MSDGASIGDLLARAWDRLWRPEPLGVLALPDGGPLPLADSDAWGPIAIALADMRLAGLAAPAGGGAVEHAPASGLFRATIALPHATLAARCTVESGAGSAGGRPLLRALVGEDALAAGAAGLAEGRTEGGNVELARSYREALLTSAPGSQLVASYYDSNDTFDDVIAGADAPNAFTVAWREGQTATVAAQTATAARQPHELTVGEPAYRTHALVLQFTLERVLQGLSREAGDRYGRAAAATARFHAQVSEPHAPQGSVTVATVMGALGTAPPPSAPGIAGPPGRVPAAPATPPGDVVDPAELDARAREIVARRYPQWESAAAAERARLEADRAASARRLAVRLRDAFALPSLALEGTVAAVGDPPLRFRVAAARVEATAPRLRPRLVARPADPSARGLLDAARSAFESAAWLHDALAVRVRARLQAPDVLAALGERLEHTINDQLRGPGG